MLLENRLLGNVRVFREIRFQDVEAGFVRRREVTHVADPFDRNVSWLRLPRRALAVVATSRGRGQPWRRVRAPSRVFLPTDFRSAKNH